METIMPVWPNNPYPAGLASLKWRNGWLGVLLVLVFSAGPAVADESWRDEVARLNAGNFPPPPEFTARYVFGWSGLTAARADVALRRGPGGRWEGKVRGATTGPARALYRLDASYDTMIDQRNWTTRETRLIEEFTRYSTDEKAEFRPGGVRSWRETTRRGAKPPRWKNFYVPGLRDIGAALLLLRSQPLRDGDRFKVAVFPGQWMYLVTARVEGREKLRWQGEMRDTIRLSLEIDWIDKKYQLRPHRKFHRGTVWASDDSLRMPLRVEVKVFVGHIFAELEEMQTGS